MLQIAASFSNHKDIVSILLNAGADPNSISQGMTPLLIACEQGFTEIAESLLQTKADITVRSLTNNQTALDIAIENGHDDIVQLLTSYIISH